MKTPSHKEIVELTKQFKSVVLHRWEMETFLHWRWWLLLVFSILPWVMWWKFADKKRLHEILLYGFFAIILILILDTVGSFMVWWEYPINIFPSPAMLPSDISIVPCLMMGVYQKAKVWKTFLLYNFLLASVMAFIGEPLFVWLGFYRLIEWHLFYSFCFYNIIGALCRWFVLKTKRQ